jgi:hypothetical protein
MMKAQEIPVTLFALLVAPVDSPYATVEGSVLLVSHTSLYYVACV